MRIHVVILSLFCLLLSAPAFAVPTMMDTQSFSRSASEPMRLKDFVQRQETTNLELLVNEALTALRSNKLRERETEPNSLFTQFSSNGGSRSKSGKLNRNGYVDGLTYDDSQAGTNDFAADGLNGPLPDPVHNLPAAPAPSAVVLGAVGISLVGWLRRRKMLSG